MGGLKVEHWTSASKIAKCAIKKNTPKQASARFQAESLANALNIVRHDNSTESGEGDTDEKDELPSLKVSGNIMQSTG